MILALSAELKKQGTTKKLNVSANTSTSNKTKGVLEKQRANPSWAWKFKQPNNTTTELQHNGRTYHWCSFHRAFCQHTEADCTLDPDHDDFKPTNSTNKKKQVTKKPTQKPTNQPPAKPTGWTNAAFAAFIEQCNEFAQAKSEAIEYIQDDDAYDEDE